MESGRRGVHGCCANARKTSENKVSKAATLQRERDEGQVLSSLRLYLFFPPGRGLHSSPTTGCSLILIGYCALLPL